MGQIKLTSRVGPDGVLTLRVPMGLPMADRDVDVVINPPPAAEDTASYHAWLREIAGSWRGDFERPDQGVLEERNPL